MTDADIQLLVQLRKELHKHPELSGEEELTAQRITDFLRHTQPTAIHDRLGGHGVVVVYDSGKPGPSIGFRCELDALPIQEKNYFDHASKSPGTSHKCGHDGHMTIVAGVGLHAGREPVRRGKLTLIFQPAEETGYGAGTMLNDGRTNGLVPEQLYALHNVPGVEEGKLVSKNDVICPASEGLVMTLEGKTSHAGQPDKGNNPAPVIAAIQLKAQAMHGQLWQTAHRTKLTTVLMALGGRAFGVNPGQGSIGFTLRSDSNEALADAKSELLEFATTQCDQANLRLSLESTDIFKAVVNDALPYSKIKQAALATKAAFGSMETPFPWSEDFGRFSEVTSTGFFGLGAGLDSPQLHHDTYDFPDELIPVGVRLFTELGRELWTF